jgi:tRNA nucleotidyltransferase (CCA-adding enzyme)
LPIPDDVLQIAQKLEGAGFETWCVGGAVRDNLLGEQNTDFDLTTAARPEEVQGLFRRTVPVGVEHGTVAVLDRQNRPHEVTTFRKDVTTDGRHAQVAFGASLDEDLARRDFTINAIAYHPLKHAWRDRFGGAEDLERRLIRAVGDPSQRFREDYLRILRALRFAARFGFQIDPPTWEAARATVEGLQRLSAERVRDEWFKGLRTARRPSQLFKLWGEVGAVGIWLPEMGSRERGAGPDAEPAGHGAGIAARGEGRTPSGPAPLPLLPALDALPRDPVLMTAYLSADPAATLSRLRCSNAEIERGRRVAEHRQRRPEPGSEQSVRRWLAAVGPAADDLVAIAEAQGPGHALAETVTRVRASGAALAMGDLAVTGDDLIAAGIPRGPALGQTLRRLLEEVLADPTLNTREKLLAYVERMTPSAPAPRSRLPDVSGERGGGSGPRGRKRK